jgi:hypothetical protein
LSMIYGPRESFFFRRKPAGEMGTTGRKKKLSLWSVPH